MKKLSLLIALAMLITVGGVYATWNYAGLVMQDVTHEFKYLSITDTDTDTQSGRVSVTDTLVLKIDDEGDYTPGWDSDVTAQSAGNLQLLFTPNPGASDTTLKYTVSIENNTYTAPDSSEAVGIFKINGVATANVAKTTILEGTFTYDAGQTGICQETITFAEITNVLKPNDEVTLPTIEHYEKYADALDNVVLSVTIVEVQ